MHQTVAQCKCFLLGRGTIWFAARCAAAALLPQFEQQFGARQLSNKMGLPEDRIVRG
jgi:hypothetical protein